MPTICPNCLRPVRTEAQYCGFCGTNLHPTANDKAAIAAAQSQVNEFNKEESTTQKQPKPKGKKIRRAVLITLIVLMCLVLLLAFLVHYWPILGPYTNAILSLFRPG